MVLLAFGVGKAQIDEAGFVFFDELHGGLDGHGWLLSGWEKDGREYKHAA